MQPDSQAASGLSGKLAPGREMRAGLAVPHQGARPAACLSESSALCVERLFALTAPSADATAFERQFARAQTSAFAEYRACMMNARGNPECFAPFFF